MQDEEVQSVWEILIGWDRRSTGCVKPLEPLQTVMMWVLSGVFPSLPHTLITYNLTTSLLW